MDKFSAMKAFVRVVEAGNFTKAAETIGVPKAQMTRLVQCLEHSLKTQLLNRNSRRVIATPDGAMYYERAVRLLDEMEDVESRMASAAVRPVGRLRIDAPSCLARAVLLPAMADFCARYPDIQIDMGVCDRPVDLMGENVDCALRIGPVTNPSLVARKIGDLPLVLCASPAYLERLGVPQSPSDLEDGQHRVIPFFFHTGRARFEYVLRRGDERYHLVAASTFALDNTDGLLAAAIAGLGVAPTSMAVAASHFAAGTLRQVLPDWCAGAPPLHLVFPPNRRVNVKVRVFIDWAAELFTRALQGPRVHHACAGEASAHPIPSG
jgi:DNA-binding transcriptional LysR family regulator